MARHPSALAATLTLELSSHLRQSWVLGIHGQLCHFTNVKSDQDSV